MLCKYRGRNEILGIYIYIYIYIYTKGWKQINLDEK